MSTPNGAPSSLAGRIRMGDPRALARALSVVEDGGRDARVLVGELHAHTGRGLTVGVTGAPGAGKSTLVAQLVRAFRAGARTVGVVAVDPSSPFSGGAILGDRVRMQEHANDPGVFIRSMATRGALGGLAAATIDAAAVLDAAGFDIVLIETVGVGQGEVDIARVADVCVVVLAPGGGDEVQAMKAGLMEIADVFVVNKADHEGTDRAVAAIEQMTALDQEADLPPAIVRTIATSGEGIDELLQAIDVARSGSRLKARRLERGAWRLTHAVARRAVDRATADDALWTSMVHRIEAGEIDADAAAALLGQSGVDGAIDHVGIATDAIGATLEFFAGVLELPVGEPEDVAAQHVRVRFVETGDARLELVEATDEESRFAASLRTRGPGLHHVALRVADLEASLARLSACGVRLIDAVPRPGAHGTRVAFVHPASTRGVLVELVERTGRVPYR